MDLHLDGRQQELLRRILDEWISGLKMEIGSTDDYTFRRELKEDKELAISILAQLDPSAAQRYGSVPA